MYAQLSKNLENACIKARRYRLVASRIILFLRSNDFKDVGIEMQLNHPSAYPVELMDILREGFGQIFNPLSLYRSTGVVLAGLIEGSLVQYGLFDDVTRIEKASKVYTAVDELSARYGKHTVLQASSLPVKEQAQHEGQRGDVPVRKTDMFKGENKRQRLGVPMIHIKI